MRLIDADVLLEPIADCEERETCDGCPCRILDCEDFERVLKAAPTVEPTNKVIAEVKIDQDELDELMERFKKETVQLMPLIPQWIPVTERLPEKPGKYLVTVQNGNVYSGTYDAYSKRFHCAAIAWMELPEPYREESEDDH